jgi:retron-type reverse transcriptase
MEAEIKKDVSMRLLEEILCDSNIALAQSRVTGNRGSGGVDGVMVEDLSDYMSSKWADIKASIFCRSYRPFPVCRVEIPKEQGGHRKLGIPTVIDRTIQQAITQVLSPVFEKEFLPHSYGFRPGRSCEQAIVQLLSYLNVGYE